MDRVKACAWVVVVCFAIQSVLPYPLFASGDGYLTPQELRIASANNLMPVSTSLGNTDIQFTATELTPETVSLSSPNNLVHISIPAQELNNMGGDLYAQGEPSYYQEPAVISGSGEDTLTLSEQWEGAQQQYGLMAPLMMIGVVTNPVLEAITGVKAGSDEAKQWGEEVYKWTGGIFNVPMVTLLGKSLSDPYSTESMSLEERGEYLVDHPLEVVEYGAAIYAGAGLISGGASAALGSTQNAVSGIMANQEISALAKGASLVKLAYGPLAAAASPILGYGTALGLGAYEYNKLTGEYTVGSDGVIVGPDGKPQAVDVLSATAYSMGAKFEHIFTGDAQAQDFSNAMYGQGVSAKLSELAQDLGTNDDGSINWAGKAVSIPIQAVNAPFAFAEFPLSFGDNVGDAQRQGWSEAQGDIGKGLVYSSIYTGQAIGGSALGMYSFAGDVLVAGPVNFADSVTGGDGKVLHANWLGESVANAPYIEALGLGKYFEPIDPSKAEYPNIDYTLANGPFLFNLRDNVLGAKETGGGRGFLGYVDTVKGVALKPVDVLTLPLNVGLEKAGSGIIDLSNNIHNQRRSAAQQASLSATQGQAELTGRITEKNPAQYEFVKDAPILAYKITSGEFTDIPQAIREQMGAVDRTTYTREYLEKNIGSVIALQMNGDKADFYIIGKETFDQKYRVVAPAEVGTKNAKLMDKLVTVPGMKDVVGSDANLVGALKQAPVPMVRMSEIGYDVKAEVTIESPWGKQTKPAGQDAFLVYDAGAKQYYMVNSDSSGNPLSYVAKNSANQNPNAAAMFGRGLDNARARENSPLKALSAQESAELAGKLAAAEYGTHEQVMNDYLKSKGIEPVAGAVLPQIMGGPAENFEKPAHDALSRGAEANIIDRILDPALKVLIPQIRASLDDAVIRFDNVNRISDVKPYLKDDAVIVLNSCSTGIPGDNLKGRITQATGVEVIAPEADSYALEFTYDAKKIASVKYEVNDPEGGHKFVNYDIASRGNPDAIKRSDNAKGADKTAVIIYPQFDDGFAFGATGLSELKGNLKDNGYLVYDTRVDNIEGAKKFIAERFGEKEIDILVIGGHGTQKDLQLGNGKNPAREISQLKDALMEYLQNDKQSYSPKAVEYFDYTFAALEGLCSKWNKKPEAVEELEERLLALRSDLGNAAQEEYIRSKAPWLYGS